MKKYTKEDKALMLEGLITLSPKFMWENHVDNEPYYLERIYWRDLFFDTIKKYCSDMEIKLPNKKLNVKQIEKWINSY